MRREIHFPTGRFGEAVEQAQAVLFLASDESSFVNGTDFVVDGGMTKVRRISQSTKLLLFMLTDLFLCRHMSRQKVLRRRHRGVSQRMSKYFLEVRNE